MGELFVTSDLITYVLAYIDQTAEALRSECGLSLLEYRMVSYLCDHVEGISPSPLAQLLHTSPASITVSGKKLAGRGLVTYEKRAGSGRKLVITKAGVDAGRDADIVIAQAHDRYFTPLPDHLKATVDIGSTVTNWGSADALRMRDGHFFAAFETLHAFLIVERLLTRSTHYYGLSLTQFRLLFEADRQGGAASPRATADALLISPSNLTYAINDLEARGYVERHRPPHDKRAFEVRLTKKGREVYARALERVEAVFTTDIRSSGQRERDAYKDAAMIMVSALRKGRKVR